MAGRRLRTGKVTIEPGGVFGPVQRPLDRGTWFVVANTGDSEYSAAYTGVVLRGRTLGRAVPLPRSCAHEAAGRCGEPHRPAARSTSS